MAKTGLKIDFTAEGARVRWGEAVRGFQATAQNALVNMGTAEGSARVHPDRGTGLWAALRSGGLIDQASAAHIGNFAALDTVFFLRSQGDVAAPEQLRACKAVPEAISAQQLELQLELTSNAGEVLGVVATL